MKVVRTCSLEKLFFLTYFDVWTKAGFPRQSSPVETGFRAVLDVTQSSHLIRTNFNAERCRPGSDLGRHFSADPNIDFFRGLLLCLRCIS